MSKKNVLLSHLILLSILFVSIAQAGNPEPPQQKKMWAQSFLGKKAPAIEVEGWIIGPGNLDGKYILVDIWATWCGPCRKIIPEMNAWQEDFKGKLVIIGITNEPKEKMELYSRNNIKYTNGYDTKARVKNALRVTGIPHVILINPEGIVVWEGFPKLPGEELTTEVLKGLIK